MRTRRHPDFDTRMASMQLISASLISFMVSAMQNGRAVMLTYDGKDRVLLPHAIGYSTKDGGLVLRAYQTGGEASRALPCWTLMRFDQMQPEHGLGMSDAEVFTEAASGYSMGDRQMSEVLCELDTAADV